MHTRKPIVSDIVSTSPDINDRHLLALAAAVETGSEHPLGKAVIEAARKGNLEIPEVEDFQAEFSCP